jgi:hypothetical protein
MSRPTTALNQSAQLMRGAAGQFARISAEAAQVDEDGHWGIDGWIRMVHNVIDLHIRTIAGVAQIALAGPGPWLQPVDREPWLSDPIPVTPTPYPRAFTIVKPFERLGHPEVRIPDTAITFVPAILQAGAESFEIDLTDNNFVGANYIGRVALRPIGTPQRASQNAVTISVTVGL